jgi:hypothetical protein
LVDRDGDGIIEISTGNDDGHQDIGEQIKIYLENEFRRQGLSKILKIYFY